MLRDALPVVAVLSALSAGCSADRGPLAPSLIAGRPSLGGTYTLTLTPCALSDGNQLANTPRTGPLQAIWTLTQQGDILTGRYRADSPPTVSSGSLTARVDLVGRVVVETLQYSWSSSHVGILTFSAAGEGIADRTQISGTVSGDNSFNTIFLGGTRRVCNGTQMPFRFTRSSNP